MYVHKVLVNPLGGISLPRKSVVRLTDRPDMTLDRLLINSIFGVFTPIFGLGTSVFQRISSKLHCGTPTFSHKCLWDSSFENPSENPA